MSLKSKSTAELKESLEAQKKGLTNTLIPEPLRKRMEGVIADIEAELASRNGSDKKEPKPAPAKKTPIKNGGKSKSKKPNVKKAKDDTPAPAPKAPAPKKEESAARAARKRAAKQVKYNFKDMDVDECKAFISKVNQEKREAQLEKLRQEAIASGVPAEKANAMTLQDFNKTPKPSVKQKTAKAVDSILKMQVSNRVKKVKAPAPDPTQKEAFTKELEQLRDEANAIIQKYIEKVTSQLAADEIDLRKKYSKPQAA
ncbi:hypothetical protein SAMN05421823_11936 [Catalinimonas alkaloidigena]|uniref:Uncharacterized protein n=1 Tax=Catalinimonas alkaloidigena TaxID=1075417 RepID=A0A1G9V6Z4_9BACT|nr:hypothetical protein [Catalinimonas alkaloidigena]SDM67929.1 hypothetical protein SAMN05421823_11936 [Catalinimonas alkaloidigena]